MLVNAKIMLILATIIFPYILQCDIRLDGGGIRSRVCLHGEENSQSRLVDVGDDDVSC